MDSASPLPPRSSLPTWLKLAAVTFVGVVTLRVAWVCIAMTSSGGLEPIAAARTYAFWALVCVPVALLSDLLLRTIAEYRITKLARARIRRTRRR